MQEENNVNSQKLIFLWCPEAYNVNNVIVIEEEKCTLNQMRCSLGIEFREDKKLSSLKRYYIVPLGIE